MRAALQEARRFRRHNQVMPPSVYQLEPLDEVSFTSARNGYVAKQFRIDTVADGDNCDQGWGLTETDPGGFRLEHGLREAHLGRRPDRAAAARPGHGRLGGVRRRRSRRLLGAEGRHSDRLEQRRRRCRRRAVPDPIREQSGYRHCRPDDGWDLGSLFVDQNIVGNTEYEARGRYRPISAREAAWSDWLPATTPDVRIPATQFDDATQAKIRQLTDQLPNVIADLQDQIESLAAGVDGHGAVMQARDGNILIGVGERLGDIAASVAAAMTAVANANEALAAYILEANAQFGGLSAEASSASSAGAAPDGAVAAIDLQARAAVDDEFVSAGIQIAALYRRGARPLFRGPRQRHPLRRGQRCERAWRLSQRELSATSDRGHSGDHAGRRARRAGHGPRQPVVHRGEPLRAASTIPAGST